MKCTVGVMGVGSNDELTKICGFLEKLTKCFFASHIRRVCDMASRLNRVRSRKFNSINLPAQDIPTYGMIPPLLALLYLLRCLTISYIIYLLIFENCCRMARCHQCQDEQRYGEQAIAFSKWRPSCSSGNTKATGHGSSRSQLKGHCHQL